MQVLSLKCPNCGDSINGMIENCPSCRARLTFKTFDSVDTMSASMTSKYINNFKSILEHEPNNQKLNVSIAFCYLKLKLYDKALVSFEKAMENNFDNSEVFFYAAVCSLAGKMAFLTPRVVIEKIEGYIKAAIEIEPKGIYYYFWTYIKYDYYERKYYNTTPNYLQLHTTAKHMGYAKSEMEKLFLIMGISKPAIL